MKNTERAITVMAKGVPPDNGTVETPPGGVNAQLPLRRGRWTDRRVWRLLTLLYLVMWVSLFQVYDGGQFIDPFNHIVYLTSPILDHDLDFANDIIAANTFDAQRRIELGQLSPEGMIKNNWPPGAALLWTPAYLAAWLLGLLLEATMGIPQPARFGFLPLAATSIATSVYGYLALWIMYRIARLWHRPAPAGAAAATVLAASPLAFHIFRCTASDHGFATLTVAWWLWLSLRPWGAHTARRGLWLGIAAGFMVLARWQDVVFGLAGIAAMWPRLSTMARRRPRELVRGLVLSMVGFFAVFGVQMIIWKATYGHWVASPHGKGYLHWDNPVFAALLLSGKGGMLQWHPAMVLGFVGLAAVAIKRRSFGLGLWVAVAAHLYICATVDDWHGEWGIGNRRLCALLPLLALGLAEVFAAMRGRVVWMMGGLIALLALGNWIFVLFGYRGSAGLFSPLNQGAWSTLLHFWKPITSVIIARPWVALIDNTFFTPLLDLGREPVLAHLGILAAFTPMIVLVLARRLGKGRRVKQWAGPVVVAVLVAVQGYLLFGMRPPALGIESPGAMANQLADATPAQLTEMSRNIDRLLPEYLGSPAVFHRFRGVDHHIRMRTHEPLDVERDRRLLARWIDRGNALDKWALTLLVTSDLQGLTPAQREAFDLAIGDRGYVERYWPHAWDQRLMQPLFERIMDDRDAEAVSEFFDRTARTPVLWWGCQWRWNATGPDPHPAAAIAALERLRIYNPLDMQMITLMIQTLPRVRGVVPDADERLAEYEALARDITDWELGRLRGAEGSMLYPRAFIEDRLNYYLAMDRGRR